MFVLMLLMACGDDHDSTTAAWALNTATVTPSEDGLSGAHTWTFYNGAWEDSQSDEDIVCEVVQELSGTVVDPMNGCAGCSHTYDIILTQVVSDCSEGLTADPGLEALLGFAFGRVPDDVAEEDPHPDESMGWYLTLDAEVMEGHGYAYDPALDRGDSTTEGDWIAGETYILVPAYAWAL